MFNFLFNLLRPPSPERTAEDMMWEVAKRAFRLFREKDFRLPLNFEKLDQTEQDRIFNEIVISGLSLVYLMLETIEQETQDAKRDLFRMVKNHFHGAYPRALVALDVEDQHVKAWYQLMAMRCVEYRDDYQQYREHLPKTSEGNPWIPVVSIGGSHHIRRGKTWPLDPIFALINQWCIDVAVMCEKRMIKLMGRLS